MSVYRIAEKGESNFHIVCHEYADETIRYACSELQKYLLKSTNAVVPYFSDRCDKRCPEIRVGNFVRGEILDVKNLAPEGFKIYGDGENIYITGGSSRGVLYGVYGFLNKFCGFNCYKKDCEVIGKFDLLDVDLGVLEDAPTFEFRDAYFRCAFDGDFSAKNHLNSGVADISIAKGGRVKWYNFHHSFNDLVSDKIFFDEHPEYFSMIEGKREKNSQLCLTNPEVLDQAEKTLRRWIKENPECKVFSIAQNDNDRRCRCEKCMALEEKENSPSGPIIHFVNALADRIKDDYPDVLLHTFAYMYSLPAPKFVVAKDNVIVRICSFTCRFDTPLEILAKENPLGEEAKFCKALSDWKNHAKRLYVWDYTVNFRNYPQPFLHLNTLKENIRFFKRVGVLGVLEQGNFAYGGGVSADDLKSYIIAKLLWNPEIDVWKEVRSFCNAVYGKDAGSFMYEYYKTVCSACESAPLSIYQFPNAEYVNDGWIKTSDDYLQKAKVSACNETVLRAIEREELSIRFLKIARSPQESINRDQIVDKFIDDLKEHGVTEIRERRPLSVSKDCLKKSQYALDRQGEYILYYIMK